MLQSAVQFPGRARLVGAAAVLTVAAAVTLPAGADAASATPAPSGAPKSAAGPTFGRGAKAPRVACRTRKVAVRKGGKAICAPKPRRAGDALSKSAPRWTAAPTGKRPVAPAGEQTTAAAQQAAADRFKLAEVTTDQLRQILANTTVGGAPTYYFQNCADSWQNGWWLKSCLYLSNRVATFRRDYYWALPGGYWNKWYRQECVYNTCSNSSF